MDNSEYIEYMEEDDKTRIEHEIEKEYFEEDEKIKIETYLNKEYFEEDVKTEIKKNTQLVNISCEICLKSFKTKSALRNHVQSVHKETKHLKTHIQSVHEAVKYSCTQCDFQATTQSNLQKHSQKVKT